MTSHNLDEINKEISQNAFHVYEGQRVINELFAKLCEAMLNLDVHDKLCGHVQALLYDPTRVLGIGEMERPPHRTLISHYLYHEEEYDGMIMMHKNSPQGHIQEDATCLVLSKNKDGRNSSMSLDSDVAPRQNCVQYSPTLVRKM